LYALLELCKAVSSPYYSCSVALPLFFGVRERRRYGSL
jgi:hypothetical protein